MIKGQQSFIYQIQNLQVNRYSLFMHTCTYIEILTIWNQNDLCSIVTGYVSISHGETC